MPYLKQALVQKESELTRLSEKISKDLEAIAPVEAYRHNHLMISSRANRTEYYMTSYENGKRKRRYMRPGDPVTPEVLAQRDYLIKLEKAVSHQLNQIRNLIQHYDENELVKLFTDSTPKRKELLQPLVIDDDTYAAKWQAVEYEPYVYENGDESRPEFLTDRGEIVRSKSEKILADRYLKLGIPYRYEYPLPVKDGQRRVILHPDFTVLNKRSRRIFYHEHLGKMDDPGYVSRNLKKLDLYEKNGIFPGDKLIITAETSERPLDLKRFDTMVKHYLV